MNVLLDGLRIGESPRWHDGRLWLSNWIAQEIVRRTTLSAVGPVA